MAKYAYAPLSIEEQRRRASAGYYPNGGGGTTTDDEDKLIQERMPMCVGICVLLAIVYVLSRTGVNQDVMMDRNHMNNGQVQSLRVSEPINGYVPVSTQPVGVSSSTSTSTSTTTTHTSLFVCSGAKNLNLGTDTARGRLASTMSSSSSLLSSPQMYWRVLTNPLEFECNKQQQCHDIAP
uniref:Uncharacterized protein n=1 Tax=Pseudo-nitzschia australis TaxID=44445 RepID=A0A7S4EGN4_9STRA